MRWISDIDEVETILRKIKEFASTKEGRQSAGFVRLEFDCVEFHSRRFLDFLRRLMEWSGDSSSFYAVLSPDPTDYFFAHFRKYPLIEIAINDPEDLYIAALTEDPGGSSADAIGTNWAEYAILPPSLAWFIRGRRDARSGKGGSLWLPFDWGNRAKEINSGLH